METIAQIHKRQIRELQIVLAEERRLKDKILKKYLFVLRSAEDAYRLLCKDDIESVFKRLEQGILTAKYKIK